MNYRSTLWKTLFDNYSRAPMIKKTVHSLFHFKEYPPLLRQKGSYNNFMVHKMKTVGLPSNSKSAYTAL